MDASLKQSNLISEMAALDNSLDMPVVTVLWHIRALVMFFVCRRFFVHLTDKIHIGHTERNIA